MTERPIPSTQAWPIERRRADMKRVVETASREGWAAYLRAPFLAATYGLLTAEAEAELMRHLSEGEGK